MTAWELLAASVLYAVAAVRFLHNGQGGMALAFAAYAVANVGLMWAARP